MTTRSEFETDLDQDVIDRLVTATLAGDPDAFDPLVVAFQGRVWAVFSRLLLPMAEVEDLVQQTFLQAYERLDRFEQGREFGAWVCGIARNQIRMHLRSRVSIARHLKNYRFELERQIDQEDATEREGDARMTALRDCQAELEGDAQAVVAMRYEEGLEFEVIAERLGRTVQATRRLLSRVRCRLKDCIDRKVVAS